MKGAVLFPILLGGLLLAVTLSACGGAGSGQPTEKNVDLQIQNRALARDDTTIRVSQGDEITLNWASDEVATVHLHGYDIEKVVEPGEMVTFTFTADATGRFPITAHGFGEAGHADGGSDHDEEHDEEQEGHEEEAEEITLGYLEVVP